MPAYPGTHRRLAVGRAKCPHICAKENINRPATLDARKSVQMRLRGPATSIQVRRPQPIEGHLVDLKCQRKPFFQAAEQYGIDPQFAVKFNEKNYLRYRERYPSIDLLLGALADDARDVQATRRTRCRRWQASGVLHSPRFSIGSKPTPPGRTRICLASRR